MRIIFAILLVTMTASAQTVVVDVRQEYVTKAISAKRIKSVELQLAKEITRHDCNQQSIILDHALVSGQGDGWYDKHVLVASVAGTEMYCPLPQPVKETILSRKINIPPFANRNVDHEVQIQVILPKGYRLLVTEIELD